MGVAVSPCITGIGVPKLNKNESDIFTPEINPNKGSLSGYVYDTLKKPLRGARVRVSFHGTYEENYTDSSGYYKVTNIPICWCLKNCTATKEGYSTEQVNLSINEKTVYDFVLTCISLVVDAYGPYYGIVNESIKFYCLASCGSEPYSWHWDFGDNNTSHEQYPKHIYTNPDIYNVILTVIDNENTTASDSTLAFVQESNSPPSPPNITGPSTGKIGAKYCFNFVSIDPEGNDIWYYIRWGDFSNRKWDGPYKSGTEITRSYKWWKRGNYTITAKAMDWYAEESGLSEFNINIHFSRAKLDSYWLRFLDIFPILHILLHL